MGSGRLRFRAEALQLDPLIVGHGLKRGVVGQPVSDRAKPATIDRVKTGHLR